jgi:hypothetical protein
MGGLGNQIFQIFTTISYSIDSNNQIKFLDIDKLGGGSTTIRYTYWNSFFTRLKPFLIKELPIINNVVREKNFTYNKISMNELINKNIMLYGYFQSYKYFQKNYELICRIIEIKTMKTNVLTKINYSKEDLERTISMHFRLGDYKKFSNFHPLATYNFYEKSLEYMETKLVDEYYSILYFCEDEDHDEVLQFINKLKETFPNFNFKRGENSLEDWEQLLLMSCCHHNIIANSSFSWWAAYFNSNKDKIVCYPSVWFGESANIDTKDLCPIEWVKIND